MQTAGDLEQFGFRHPMGPDWRGIQDLDPAKLPRERMRQFCADMDPEAIRSIFPVGSVHEVARQVKGFADAGMRVFKILDYGTMAGTKFAPGSAAKVRAVEDEIQRLVEG
jgi:phthiodiolone/phenolphthiodiolone dimycocerosates ketoreductase